MSDDGINAERLEKLAYGGEDLNPPVTNNPPLAGPHRSEVTEVTFMIQERIGDEDWRMRYTMPTAEDVMDRVAELRKSPLPHPLSDNSPVTHNPQEDAFYEKVDPRKAPSCPRCSSWRVQQIGVKRWHCCSCQKRWSVRVPNATPRQKPFFYEKEIDLRKPN